MHSPYSLLALVFATLIVFTQCASEWSFKDASVTVKGRGEGAKIRTEIFKPSAPQTAFLNFADDETLEVKLKITENGQGKRPHQAFLVLREPATGVEESWPFKAKSDGSATLSLAHKDLPIPHLTTDRAINARVTIGSFGQATPLDSMAFMFYVKRGTNAPAIPTPEAPERYKSLPQIVHQFKADPKNPPAFIAMCISMVILASVPVLLGTWLTLGANLNGLSDALGEAPLAYGGFYGGLVLLELVFFMYYVSWSLFQTLPAVALVGAITFVSGSRALSETQTRRLQGKR